MGVSGKPTLRILLIEDDADDALLVIDQLRKDWRPVWHRVENEPALLLALDKNWDVILCDVRLPNFNAEKALSATLEYLALKNASMIPFIVISGVVREEDVLHMLKKGARDFISKDNLNRLTFAIHRELRQSGELLASQLQIEESYDTVLEAWGKAVEMRDYFTKGHTERVTSLAVRLGIEMNLGHKEFVNLYRGALLHDVGKIAMPDSVLLKRDSLDIDEMKIMQMHPTIAYNMLKDIPFLKHAIAVPYCHHERWDGSGYPQGLVGAEIPLLARIFSVVDVYDALSNDRPYRSSWEKSNVIAYIIEKSGTQFDPVVIETFIGMIERG